MCYYTFVKKITLLLLLTCMIFSCSKNELKDKSNSRKWEPTDTHVAVLFGYGYNTESFVNEVTSKLSEKFGLQEEGGLILPLVFPDSFKSGGVVGRISNLPDILSENKCKTLITLGAPENTHRALAKMQDANSDCVVYSLFSQDDVLGTESGSYLVFDFATENNNSIEEDMELTETVGLEEQELSDNNFDKIEFLLEKIIKRSNLPSTLSINEVASSLFDSDWEVSTYLDAATGLKAKNHFVLKDISTKNNQLIEEANTTKKNKKK